MSWSRLVALPLVLATAVLACTGSEPDFGAPQSAGDGGAVVGPTEEAGALAPLCPVEAVACSTGCAVLTSDGANCGACGHSCAGSSCQGGVCQPSTVAENVDGPIGVAAAKDTAFWLRNGAVESCAGSGCRGAPLVVSKVNVEVPSDYARGTTIVTDGNYVAWIGRSDTGYFDVHSASSLGLQGDYPPKHLTKTDNPQQLAIVGSTIFASTVTFNEAVNMAPISTLARATIAGTNLDQQDGVTADGNNVYLVGTNGRAERGVFRCPRTGCVEPATLLFGGVRLVVSAGESGLLVATTLDGRVVTGLKAGNGRSELLAPATSPSSLAANERWAVWAEPGATAEATGSVKACRLPTCEGGARSLATRQASPVAVALDGDIVYWANQGNALTKGSIWRVAL